MNTYTGLPRPWAFTRAAIGEEFTIFSPAAHAVGAYTADEKVGACRYSDMAIFSFHPVKGLTTGEGGLVTTRDERLRDGLAVFRTHGITPGDDPDEGAWFQEQHLLGFNYRMTDIQAALGSSQLARLEAFIVRRNAVADRYRAALDGYAPLTLPPAAPAGGRHAHHLFVVHGRDGAEARRALYDGLKERAIYAQVHYVPVYRHPYYRETYGYERGLCPAAEDYYAGCLSLPCFPDLTESEQDTVVDAVKEVLG